MQMDPFHIGEGPHKALREVRQTAVPAAPGKQDSHLRLTVASHPQGHWSALEPAVPLSSVGSKLHVLSGGGTIMLIN